jgi:hypothetical protein
MDDFKIEIKSMEELDELFELLPKIDFNIKMGGDKSELKDFDYKKCWAQNFPITVELKQNGLWKTIFSEFSPTKTLEEIRLISKFGGAIKVPRGFIGGIDFCNDYSPISEQKIKHFKVIHLKTEI